MIVIDASVLAVALGDDGPDGNHARERLVHETLVAPELIDLEVVSVWRRLVVGKKMAARRAGDAVSDLADLPLRRSSHQPLLGRIWELRHAVTAYDAAYLALAEALRLGRACPEAGRLPSSTLGCGPQVASAPAQELAQVLRPVSARRPLRFGQARSLLAFAAGAVCLVSGRSFLGPQALPSSAACLCAGWVPRAQALCTGCV